MHHFVFVAENASNTQEDGSTDAKKLPRGQESQEKEPGLLLHRTKGETEQPPLLLRHSLMSVHRCPLPV